EPADHPPTLAEARALLTAQRWEEAAAAFAAYLKTNPDHGSAWRQDAYVLSQLHRCDEAVTAYQHAFDLGDRPNTCAYNTACCFALLGKRDEAIEWLTKAFHVGFTDFHQLATDTDLDSIRSDPRFQRLLGPAVPAEIS